MQLWLFQSIIFTILSGAVINDITNNPMVLANIEELQKAWDDLNDLLEEKEKDLQVSQIQILSLIPLIILFFDFLNVFFKLTWRSTNI